MAGFEVVVRPVVFPDIRPAPARSLPPQDDPEKGFAEIKGSGGQHIDLTYSMSSSVQISRPNEEKRQVDVVRIHQNPLSENPAARISARAGEADDNYVDFEVATKIWSKSGQGRSIAWYQRPRAEDNVEILQRDKIRTAE